MLTRRGLALLLSWSLWMVGTPGESEAQSPFWEQVGPWGGRVLDVVTVTRRGSRVYVATAANGVFRSVDYGRAWDRAGLDGRRVEALAAGEASPDLLLAALDTGELFRNGADGLGWVRVNDGNSFPSVRRVAFHCQQESVALAATAAGLFRSLDRGRSWSEVGGGLPPGTDWRRLGCSSADGSLLLASQTELFRSTDRGASWRRVDFGAAGDRILALAADLSGSRWLLSLAGAGLLMSDDAGASWAPTGSELGTQRLQWFSRRGNHPVGLYGVDGQGRVWASSNRGSAWALRNVGQAVDRRVSALAVAPVRTERLYVGGVDRGVLRSLNAGGNFEASSLGVNPGLTVGLEIDPEDSTSHLAAVDSLGLLRSRDAGRNWQMVYALVPEGEPEVMTGGLARLGDRWLATTSLGLIASEDDGASWSRQETAFECFRPRELVADPHHPERGWLLGGSPSAACGLIPNTCSLFRTADSGKSWNCSENQTVASHLAFDPNVENLLYASAGLSFSRSIDGGVHWAPAGAGLGPSSVVAIEPDPVEANKVWVVDQSGQVSVSEDGGQIFQPVDLIGFQDPTDLLAVEENGEVALYLAELQSRVFRWQAGQTTAEPVGVGLAGGFYDWSLRVAPDRPWELWAISGIPGAERLVLPRSGSCVADVTTLCLEGDYQVRVRWTDFEGRTGLGQAVELPPLAGTVQSGYFWFFDPENIEMVIKVLDGRLVNDHIWTFNAALTNVEYQIEIANTRTGERSVYHNPSRRFASLVDLEVFRAPPFGAAFGSSAAAVPTAPKTTASAGCEADEFTLCLNEGRFRATLTFDYLAGGTLTQGLGRRVPLTERAGGFWFFNHRNLEVVLKVVDGREVNGHFWLFVGGLTNLAYSLTVEDTETGETWSYDNPPGDISTFADTTAF